VYVKVITRDCNIWSQISCRSSGGREKNDRDLERGFMYHRGARGGRAEGFVANNWPVVDVREQRGV
jgi:hypothetical protein